MNNANQVADKIAELKKQLTAKEISLSEAVFETAKACVGWAYVYGSWGAYCTTYERKKRQGYHPEKTEITRKCQVLNGSKSSCTGCKWFPGGEKTRCYDCRGFTDWCMNQFGDFGVVDLYGDIVDEPIYMSRLYNQEIFKGAYGLGDEITLKINGRERTFTVAGFYESISLYEIFYIDPVTLSEINSENTACRRCGYRRRI